MITGAKEDARVRLQSKVPGRQAFSKEGGGVIKRIIVACGTAIATSTHVASKIKKALEDRNLKVPILQCRVSEIEGLARDSDVVVSTTQVPSTVRAKVVSGLPILLGRGDKEVIEEIIRFVSEK